MKKLIALSLILLAIGAMAFADDAKVMPGMVGRLYVAPNFSFASSAWDDDSEKVDFDDSIKVFNLAFALEFGVIDWITAAIQWTPGWTAWSDLEGATGFKDSNTNGVADLFVGAKIQIIGEKAPVQNDTFRLALALGAKIPLPGPDFEKEAVNLGTGKEATLVNMDNHVFGAGARFYFDWQLADSFFINLYNETILYLGKKNMKDAGLTEYGTLAAAAASGVTGGEVDYKYELTFEIEGVYTTSIADGVSLTAGLPVNFKYKPEFEYSFDFAAAVPDAAKPVIKENLLAALAPADSLCLSINPNVSVFLTKTPLPLEFKLGYNLPVWGKNAQATNTVVLQIKAYFALPGADI